MVIVVIVNQSFNSYENFRLELVIFQTITSSNYQKWSNPRINAIKNPPTVAKEI